MMMWCQAKPRAIRHDRNSLHWTFIAFYCTNMWFILKKLKESVLYCSLPDDFLLSMEYFLDSGTFEFSCLDSWDTVAVIITGKYFIVPGNRSTWLDWPDLSWNGTVWHDLTGYSIIHSIVSPITLYYQVNKSKVQLKQLSSAEVKHLP